MKFGDDPLSEALLTQSSLFSTLGKFEGPVFIPIGANPVKWLNTLKQFVGNSRRID